MSQLPLATPEQKQDITRRLVEGNLQLAVRIARLYQGRGVALADLVGHANVPLSHAAAIFTPAPDRAFRPSAQHAMRGAFCLLLKKVSQDVISLDGLTIPIASPEREWVQIADLYHALAALPRRDEHIIRLRYLEQHSLEEVGKRGGVTRERVRQREKQALHMLRKSLVSGVPHGNPVGDARPPVPLRKERYLKKNLPTRRRGMQAQSSTTLLSPPLLPTQHAPSLPHASFVLASSPVQTL